MRQCACSSSALSIFISSIAGLNLRSSIAQSTIRSTASNQTVRQQIYRTAARRLLSVQATPAKDAALSSDVSVLSQKVQDGSTRKDTVASSNAPNRQDHAVRTDKPIDHNSSLAATRSRQENRMARKVRRMTAGTWQPQTQARLTATKEEQAARHKERNVQGMNARKSAVSPKVVAEAEIVNEGSQETGEILEAGQIEVKPKRRKPESTEDKTVLDILKKVEEGRPPKAPRLKTSSLSARQATTELPGDIQDADHNNSRRSGRPEWGIQKAALKEKFKGEAWNPRKRLSPDSLNGIRALHESDPDIYTTPVLAEHFKITSEAVRRILKGKWRPKEEEIEDRRQRWERRGVDRRKGILAQKTRSRNAREINVIMNPLRVD